MYILECSDGTFYTGSAYNLTRRLEEHNYGVAANYTKKRLPVRLYYAEEYERIDDAFMREKQIQKWSHGKKIALAEKDFDALKFLSECQNDTHWNNKENSDGI
jgi:putative endonuclease